MYYKIKDGFTSINKEQKPIQASTQEEEQEGLSSYLLRQGARLGTRAVETAAGIPGEIGSLALKGLGAITTEPSYREKAQEVSEYMPTRENIHEKITKPIAKKYLTEKYLEPQSETEKFLDDLVSDTVSYVLPFGVAGKVGKIGKVAKKISIPLKKAFQVSGISNIGSYLSKSMGASPKTQAGIKLGLGLLATNVDLFDLKNMIKRIPEDKTKIGEFINTIEEEVLNKFPNLAQFEQPIASNVNIPRRFTGAPLIKRSRELSYEQAKDILKQGTKNFPEEGLRSSIKETGNAYVRQHIRRILPLTATQKEKARILEELNKAFDMASFIKRTLPSKLQKINPITGSLLGSITAGVPAVAGGLISGHPWISLVGLGTLGTHTVYKLHQAIKLLSSSGELRKVYAKALSAASKKSVPLFTKAVRDMDKVIEKQNEYEFKNRSTLPSQAKYYKIKKGII